MMIVRCVRKYPAHPADGATYHCETKLKGHMRWYSVDAGVTWWIDARAAAIAAENTEAGMTYMLNNRELTVRSKVGFPAPDHFNIKNPPDRFGTCMAHDMALVQSLRR